MSDISVVVVETLGTLDVLELTGDPLEVVDVGEVGGPPGAPGAPGPIGPPGPGVPVGGTVGQVLAKTSATDFATGWATPGGSTRTVVPKASVANTGVLGDAGGYLRFTASNPTYTVPPNSAVAFPVGTQIDGIGSATAMTLIQGSGVIITKARTLVTVGAGSGWTLIKTGTDAWDLHGDFV